MLHHPFKSAISVFALSFSFALTCALASAAVHPGDKLHVNVYNYPDLSADVTVDSAGRVSLPLAGTISVQGLGETGISRVIARRLAYYISKPAVSVQRTAEAASIFISGGPGGTLTSQAGQTLASILTDIPKLDGSDILHSRVDLHRVGLLRDGKLHGPYDVIALSSSGKAAPNVEAGDTIMLVNKPVLVYVLGEVANPGATYLRDDEPLSDAITQVGGVLPTAATAGVILSSVGSHSVVAMGDPALNSSATQGETVTVPVAPRIMVVGMVATPGPVILRSSFSLISALYAAGGPNKFGNLRDVQVVHGNSHAAYDITRLVHGDLSQNPTLQDGDLVVVPEGHRIDFTSVLQALANARWALAL